MNNANDTGQSGSPIYQMPISSQGVTDSPTFAPPRPTAADVPRDPGGPVVLPLSSSQSAQAAPSHRDVAQMLLGDASLEDDVQVIGDTMFIRGVPIGPPAKWAAATDGLRGFTQ